jgi:replicative DNA helicase
MTEVLQPRVLHSHEAEQAVIGAALLDNEVVAEVQALGLRQQAFSHAPHRILWHCIASMLEARQPADVITVSDYVESIGKGELVGGLAYIGTLVNNTPGSINAAAYAQAVLNYAQEREWVAVAERIRDVFMDQSGLGHTERVGQAESLLSSLSFEQGSNSLVTLDEALRRYIEELDERYHSDGGIRGLLTHYRHVDYRLNGMQPGDLVIVAGRPAMGKTTYAMNIATNAIMDGKGALVFSMEMNNQKLVQRLVASQGRIKLGLLQTAKIDEDDSGWQKVTTAVSRLKGKRLSIDDQAGLTIADIRARALREHRRNKLDVVVVDYIGLVESVNSRDNVAFRIAEISRGLKILAKEIGGVVIALSQVNRECENRANKRPKLSDLRDSGAIEQDADVVQFCYRDEYYNEDSAAKGQLEVITAKCRDGEPGTDYLIWKGHYNLIEDNPDPNGPPVSAYANEFNG